MKLRKLFNVWTLVILIFVTNVFPNVHADNGTVDIMTDKQEYKIGEDSDITVEYCHTTSATDWIGIYKKGITPGSSSPSILWKYAEVTDDYKTMIFTDAISALTVGDYKAVLLENDGYTVKAEYPFAVKDTEAPEIYLSSETYDIDYNITVYYKNAKTSKDWIGIYKKGATPGATNPCYAYKYVSSLSEGSVSFTPEDVANYQYAPEKKLSAGEYEFIFMHNDGYDILSSVNFMLKDMDSSTLNAPVAVTYTRNSDKAGYADGTVTIAEPDDTSGISSYVLYWGDANGKLADYDAIATLGQGVRTYTMVKNTFIPATATRLLVYSSSGIRESQSFASFDIPAGWCIDQSGRTSQFEVFSDTHVTPYDSIYNTRFGNALKDIYTIAPDSEAIFANGDNVDMGHPDNYKMYLSILNQYKEELPEINFIIGNHEYHDSYSDRHHNNNMTCKEKADQFMEELGAPGIYYDKYINKMHFIALGSEMAEVVDGPEGTYYISDDTYISDAQFDWLENKLAETKDQKTPIFVFHHQPMADTVAGSIGGKSGQGWNGLSVQQDARLRSILFKYPQVIMFNGHTHWEMESPHEMYDGGKVKPTIFNTASVGYLWTDIPYQMEVVGSQGFYVETYQDKVLVRGRDFENGLWIPSASFIVDMNDKYGDIHDAADSGGGSSSKKTTTATGAVQPLKIIVDGQTKQMNIEELNPKNNVYEVQTNASGNTMKLGLKGSSLNALREKSAGAVLKLNAVDTSYSLPLEAVDITKIAKEMGVEEDDLSISITVQKADASDAELSTSMDGAQIVTSPIDFKIEVSSGNGQTKALNDMKQYVSRTLLLKDITDSSHLTGVMYDPDSSKYIFVPSTFQTSGGDTTATLKRYGNSIYTVMEYSKTFPDAQNHWANQYIEELASKFIVNGDNSGNFNPDASITRAEFISMVVRSLGIPEEKGNSNFSDVNNQWFAGAVNAASKSDLASGYKDGTFKPENNISRQEITSILCNAIKFSGASSNMKDPEQYLSKFEDQAVIGTWARESIGLAVKYGIVDGTPSGQFMPQSNATRSEAAAMLTRMLKLLKFID